MTRAKNDMSVLIRGHGRLLFSPIPSLVPRVVVVVVVVVVAVDVGADTGVVATISVIG